MDPYQKIASMYPKSSKSTSNAKILGNYNGMPVKRIGMYNGQAKKRLGMYN